MLWLEEKNAPCVWFGDYGVKDVSLKALLGYDRTRKYCFDVPGCDGVNDGVHIEHDYRDGEAVGVSFHRAGVEVVPLDAHTLFFILREILTAESKGHRRQEALRKREQTV